jgi:hypothetical protein
MMDESQTPPTHLGSCRYLTLCRGVLDSSIIQYHSLSRSAKPLSHDSQLFHRRRPVHCALLSRGMRVSAACAHTSCGVYNAPSSCALWNALSLSLSLSLNRLTGTERVGRVKRGRPPCRPCRRYPGWCHVPHPCAHSAGVLSPPLAHGSPQRCQPHRMSTLLPARSYRTLAALRRRP